MDPIRPIGPRTGDELRVIPVAPARIRDRDAREGDARQRERKRRDRDQRAPETPGHLDVQA
jgi:hypothetical protein